MIYLALPPSPTNKHLTQWQRLVRSLVVVLPVAVAGVIVVVVLLWLRQPAANAAPPAVPQTGEAQQLQPEAVDSSGGVAR